MNVLRLDWTAPGPVCARFMASTARVQVLNGPVGSGKTTAVLLKAIKLAARQSPAKGRRVSWPVDPEDRSRATAGPVRMFRLCVVRDTYRQLWRSTLPSWWKRVPKEVGTWSGADNGPGRHQILFSLDGKTVIEFIADFIAIGDNSVEDVMRGYEPTAFYLNEADLLSWDVYVWARSRWGRYPGMELGGPDWWGLFMDCNAPQIGTPLHDHVFLDPGPDIELFRQPSGFDALGENKANLPPGYYDDMAAGMPEPMVNRLIRNLPGFTLSGKPVHPEFNDLLHTADRVLDAVPGLPILIGFDAGLDPAAVLCQKLGNGRWRVIDELVSEHGTGPVRFARALNELLAARYGDWQVKPLVEEPTWTRPMRALNRGKIRGWADPSSQWGVDRQEDEQSWLEIVAWHTGIRIDAAPSNDTTLRRAALARVLTLMPDGKPAFQISPRCKMVRAGLAGGFRYRRLQLGAHTEDRWTDEVEKNQFSHPCEALEYVLMGGGEAGEVLDRRARGFGSNDLPRTAADDWNPLGSPPR